MIPFVVFLQNTEGARKMIFPTLKELVSKFEKPDQGLVFHLSKPINRPSLGLRHRTSQLASENLYGKSVQKGISIPISPKVFFAESIQRDALFYDITSEKSHTKTISTLLRTSVAVPEGSQDIEPGKQKWSLGKQMISS